MIFLVVGSSCPATHQEVKQRSGDTATSLWEVARQLLVSWKVYLSMQDHCSVDRRVNFVTAKGAEGIGYCC